MQTATRLPYTNGTATMHSWPCAETKRLETRSYVSKTGNERGNSTRKYSTVSAV